jgi:predicted permease
MRYAIRSLWQAKEFTAVAVIVIAIGIGATTAVFSVVDAALLQPLPFKDSSRLYVLGGVNPRRGIDGASFSYPAYVELAAHSQMLSGLAAVASDRFNSTGAEQAEQLPGGRVSASFFNVLGVETAAGRTFTPAEDAAGAPAAAILGRRYWMRRFNGLPSVVGTALTLNGTPYTVVGALGIDLPPPFDDVDVWTTQVEELSGFTRAQIDAGLGYLSAIARLPPEARLESVQAQVDIVARAYARANPTNTDADPDASLRLVPIRDRTVGDVRTPLLLLMGAVGLVLLIACANVANLLLARAGARAHEAAVRAALGARRRDLTWWLCRESFVLALVGGLGGVVLAYWSVDLASAALQRLPRAAAIAVDGRVLLFSLSVSLAAGLFFGLVPSSFLSTRPPVDALKRGGRGSIAAPRAAGRVLVVAEVALSLMLLVGAGLLLQSFTRLTRIQVGFKPDGLLTLRLSLPSSQYPDAAAMRRFMSRLMPGLDAAPGVAHAAASMSLPPSFTTMAPYAAGDRAMVPIGNRPVGQWSAIDGEYFETLGIPIVAGRSFNAGDTERSPLVVVVSQGLARGVWPDQSPLGQKLLVGRFPGFAEVVGVAGDVKNNGLARAPMFEMYTPYAQRPWPAMQIVLRAAPGGDPMALAGSVRAVLRGVDRDLPITRVETMNAALSDSIATERLTATLLLAFAGVALVMAAAGLYGVIAYTVARRTREIGVRVALGADARSVIGLIAAEGFGLTLAGMVIGTAAAALVSRGMRGLLVDVSPVDPTTYAVVLAVFAATACAALVIPARRALRVDPLVALQAD